MDVEPSNQQQAESWDGEQGAYWAARAKTIDRAMANHHAVFMDAAAIGPDDRILDVGCGTGLTSRDAARLGSSGSVLGIDLSSPMLAVARERAAREGLGNVEFIHGDAQVHPFERESFDGVISQTGAMFFGDPVVAFSNLAASMRPAGRLTLLTWQPLTRNEWFREVIAAAAVGRDLQGPPPGAPGPFGLCDPARAEQILTDAGFQAVSSRGHDAPMWFGEDVDGAYDFFVGLVGWLLDGLDADGRAQGLEALRRTISAHCSNNGVIYDSATWIITASRMEAS